MKQFRISLLVVALSLMVTGMAFAVDIPNISTWTQSMGVGGGGPGRGDALIAPLYDVRPLTDTRLPGSAGTTAQTQFTLLSIVNTDRNYGAIVRMRFREWKRSRECLDIDIPLTTNDVWVGQVAQKTGGGATLTTPAGGGERWVSANPVQSSVTVGAILYPYGYFPGALFPTAGLDFTTYAIEAEETNKLARCEYGYIEFFGEERVAAPTTTAEPWLFPRIASTTDALAGCTTANEPACNGYGRDVHDVLMGNIYLVRPTQAISHQYNMTALSDFAVDSTGIWFNTAFAQPNFYDSVQGGPGNLGTNPGIGGFIQLEAILARRLVYAQYITGTDPADSSATPMSTSEVITFPTKHFHYDTTDNSRHESGALALIGTQKVLRPPFTGLRETLHDELVSTAIAACSVGENVILKIYDRNEHTFAPGAPISPPPVIPPGKLPYEVNVIGFYPSESATSEFRNNVVASTAGGGQTFYEGYAITDLGSSDQGEDTITFNFFGNIFQSYNGLPAVGIVMSEFYNGGVQGYYGNTVPWQYRVDWYATTTAPNNINLANSPGMLSTDP
ncbi:MAG: hypothetical protein ABSB32_18345 [Thermodesulfobacteriota bacterium]